MVRY